MNASMTRRQLIKASALGGAGALLAACGATPTPQTVEVTREVHVQSTVEVTKLLRDSDLGILPQWTRAVNQLNQIWNDLFTAVVQTQTDIKQLADDAQSKAEAAMKA